VLYAQQLVAAVDDDDNNNSAAREARIAVIEALEWLELDDVTEIERGIFEKLKYFIKHYQMPVVTIK
jgi:hypothetical protein